MSNRTELLLNKSEKSDDPIVAKQYDRERAWEISREYY